jgi:hypothetical protein
MSSSDRNRKYIAKPLTDDQIESILADVDHPPGLGKSAREQARQNVIELMRMALKQIKLVDIPEEFNAFKKIVIDDLYESYVNYHKAIGMNAAIGISAPMTQMTLNTQRSAGTQSGVTSGFNKIRELIMSSKSGNKIDMRALEMKVYLKEPFECDNMHEVLHTGTRESIFDMRPIFEQTSVERLIVNYENLIKAQVDVAKLKKMFDTQKILFPEKYGRNTVPNFDYVLKITIDTYRLYSHKIKLQKVVEAIEGNKEVFICLWDSGLSDTIYVLINSLAGIENSVFDNDTAYPTFFTQECIKKSPEWIVGGMSSVKSIEPFRYDVLAVVEDVEVVKGNIKLKFSHRSTRFGGASLADIIRLLKACGYKIIKYDHQPHPYIIVDSDDINIVSTIRKKYIDIGNKPVEKRTDDEKLIMEVKSFFGIRTYGANFSSIVWREDIDVFRSYPNNANMIADIAGIDGADLFLNVEYVETIQRVDSKFYTDPRHIELMFKMKTNLGIVTSLGHSGLNRRAIGATSAASQERATDFFTASAIYGTREPLDGISSRIYIGRVSNQIGSGAVMIQTDQDYLNQTIPSDISDYPQTIGVLDEIQPYENEDFQDLFGNSLLAETEATTAEKVEFGLQVLEQAGTNLTKEVSPTGGFDLGLLSFDQVISVPNTTPQKDNPVINVKDLNLDDIDELEFVVDTVSKPAQSIEIKLQDKNRTITYQDKEYEISNRVAVYLDSIPEAEQNLLLTQLTDPAINMIFNLSINTYQELYDKVKINFQAFAHPLFNNISLYGGKLWQPGVKLSSKDRILIMPVLDKQLYAVKANLVKDASQYILLYNAMEADTYKTIWEQNPDNRLYFRVGAYTSENLAGLTLPNFNYEIYAIWAGMPKTISAQVQTILQKMFIDKKKGRKTK